MMWSYKKTKQSVTGVIKRASLNSKQTILNPIKLVKQSFAKGYMYLK
ncbi:uncharacterized protein METZ01_LOCUS397391 [marine metagenome]|uniref:Uncharacterized protein n=1 Tax=marine metagenome TaxID=408172 RepID=A0A382VDK3_9ZZZZ